MEKFKTRNQNLLSGDNLSNHCSNENHPFGLWSENEENFILESIKNGDQDALKVLIASKQLLVIDIAKRFQDNGLPLLQLIIKGTMGIEKAALHYDQTKNYSFNSCLIWYIRQSIIQAFAENLSISQGL